MLNITESDAKSLILMVGNKCVLCFLCTGNFKENDRDSIAPKSLFGVVLKI